MEALKQKRPCSAFLDVNNETDTDRHQDSQQSEYTQLRIHADDLDWQLGICSNRPAPGIANDFVDSDQDFSFWPAWSPQWNGGQPHQSLDATNWDCRSPAPVALEENLIHSQPSVPSTTPERKCQSNRPITTGFVASETNSFRCDELVSFLLQEDAAAAPSKLPTSALGLSIDDVSVASETIVNEKDVDRMQLWSQSPSDLQLLEQPRAGYGQVPTDILTGSFLPLEHTATFDYNKADNFGFYQEQVQKNTSPVSSSPLWPAPLKDFALSDFPFDLEQSFVPKYITSQGLHYAPHNLSDSVRSLYQPESTVWNSLDSYVKGSRFVGHVPLDSLPVREFLAPATEGIPDQCVLSPVHKMLRISSEKTSSSSYKRAIEWPKPLVWDNTALAQLQRHGSVKETMSRPGGRRKGRLKPEQAKTTKEVRDLRACLPCWLSKIRCSAGTVCTRCTKMSPLDLKLCTRARLEDYSQLFFPDLLVSHLQETMVQKLEVDVCSAFVDNTLEVDIICGWGHLPMKLQATEFVPTRDELSRFPVISSGGPGQESKFCSKWPSPLALRSFDMCTLTETCRRYITAIVHLQNPLSEKLPGDLNKVSHRVLDATCQYYSSIPSSPQAILLEKALMVHVMHRFMGWTITLTAQSQEHVANSLRRPSLRPCETNLISTLLNSQVKSAMLSLLREVTQDILEELEKEIKSRDKSVWATAFCVVAILCISMEDVQNAIDGLAIHTKINGSGNNTPLIQDRIDACRKLDDLLFDYLSRLFHGVFKTNKSSTRGRKGRAYNPIRDGAENFGGSDHESSVFVGHIRSLLSDDEICLTKLAETPSLDSDNHTLDQHISFRKHNSARLLSKFLKPFLSV